MKPVGKPVTWIFGYPGSAHDNLGTSHVTHDKRHMTEFVGRLRYFFLNFFFILCHDRRTTGLTSLHHRIMVEVLYTTHT